jgi:VHL beta domain
MDGLGDLAPKILGWFQAAPWWLKIFGILWIMLSATIIVGAFFIKSEPTPPISNIPEAGHGGWPRTGDIPIDQAHRRLNSLQTKVNDPSDQSLLEALKPLFLRDFYTDVRNESWSTDLFSICRTQILINTYVSWFKEPEIRSALLSATGLLSNIQRLIAPTYGPAFEAQDQCRNFGSNIEDYTKALPGRIAYPDDQKIEQMNSYLRRIRDVCRPVGLIDFDPSIDNFKPTPAVSASEVLLSPTGNLPSSPTDRSYGSDPNPTPATANIFFSNMSAYPVKVVWLTPDGYRKKYADLGPGASYLQPTYEGHLWMLTTAEDKPLAMYRALSGYQKVVYR